MLKTITLEEIQKERPDLIDSIKKIMEVDTKKTVDAAVQEAIKNKEEQLKKDAEAAKLKEARASKIKALVGVSKLPKRAIDKLCDKLMKESYADDAAVEKAVKDAIAEELSYIAEVGGRKIGVDTGAKNEGDPEVKEKVQASLEERFNLSEKKKEEDKSDVQDKLEKGFGL